MPKPKTGNFGTYKHNALKSTSHHKPDDGQKRVSIHKQLQLKWGRNYMHHWWK